MADIFHNLPTVFSILLNGKRFLNFPVELADWGNGNACIDHGKKFPTKPV